MLPNTSKYNNHAAVCVRRTPDFERYDLLRLDETDDLLVDAGGDGVSVDTHDLITNLSVNTGGDIMHEM